MINYDAKLDHIQDSILRLAESGTSQGSDTSLLEQLKDHLASLEAERTLRRRQTAIIKSLYFKGIRRRWDAVADADKHTNTWLFDGSKTDFLEWLESGTGMYWITGKVRQGSLFSIHTHGTMMNRVTDGCR